jgi:hypothetical protein
VSSCTGSSEIRIARHRPRPTSYDGGVALASLSPRKQTCRKTAHKLLATVKLSREELACTPRTVRDEGGNTAGGATTHGLPSNVKDVGVNARATVRANLSVCPGLGSGVDFLAGLPG